MALAGRKCLVKLTGTATGMIDEPMTLAGNGLSARVTDTTKRIIDPTAAVVVERDTGGGFSAFTDYTIDRLLGKITFDSDQTGNDFQITTDYLPATTIAEAHDFSYSLSADWPDQSVFTNTFVRREVSGLKDASGSVGRFYEADDLFYDALNNGALMVLEHWFDTTQDLLAWFIPSTRGVSSDVANAVEESLDWEGTLDADMCMVSFGWLA